MVVFAQSKSGLFCAPCVGVDVCEGTGVGVTWLVSALTRESLLSRLNGASVMLTAISICCM